MIYSKQIIRIAVCDVEEDYVLKLAACLDERLKDAFQVFSFTDPESVFTFSKEQPIYLYIFSQSVMKPVPNWAAIEKQIVLKEEEILEEDITWINRFQGVEQIMQEIVTYLADQDDLMLPKRMKDVRCKLIALYSPVKRSLQTTFSIALGQMLSENAKVLYMNFEGFSGFSGIFHQEFPMNMTDLLYFYDCNPDKLKNRLPSLIHTVGGLDMVPPAGSIFEFSDVPAKVWKKLVAALMEMTDYDYLILDLSEAVKDWMELMLMSDRIYTLVKEDRISIAKYNQYIKWLELQQLTDISEKTRRVKLPYLESFPEQVELLSKGGLSQYVRTLIREDLNEL